MASRPWLVCGAGEGTCGDAEADSFRGLMVVGGERARRLARWRAPPSGANGTADVKWVPLNTAGLPNGGRLKPSAGASWGDLPRDGARSGESGPEDPGPPASDASCRFIMPKSTDAARSLRKNRAAAAGWSVEPLAVAPRAPLPLPATDVLGTGTNPRFRAPPAACATWAMTRSGASLRGETIPAQTSSHQRQQTHRGRKAAPLNRCATTTRQGVLVRQLPAVPRQPRRGQRRPRRASGSSLASPTLSLKGT